MTTRIYPLSALQHPPATARVGAMLRIVGRALAQPFVQMVQAWRNRQLLVDMRGMSDHELADIGLRRGDLADATALPLNREPGVFLAQRVVENRMWRPPSHG